VVGELEVIAEVKRKPDRDVGAAIANRSAHGGAKARCCHRLARESVVGELEVIAEVKRKPDRDVSARDKRERTHQENALDEALKDTFPASDPEQPTPPAADRDRAKT
jgi:hypothetical protein